jgi:hypothetical protein
MKPAIRPRTIQPIIDIQLSPLLHPTSQGPSVASHPADHCDGLFEGLVNAVAVELASLQFVAAMVLPLFVLWNNLAGRRRFRHDAWPDTIFRQASSSFV